MNRRDFIKRTTGAVVATSAVLTACKNADKRAGTLSTESITEQQDLGEMTMRINPNTGDKVSILGFGMMRLPVLAGGTARENPDSPIDQETVNAMVDYALEHGVNYFDTSPVYCQGESERSTGIALSRHKRNSYFIATKLSNFSPEIWNFDDSKAMFENSLKDLQTDYIDYLLLHGIGMSRGGRDGMGSLYARFLDNGLLDWLVEQKKAGRIRNLGFSYHGDIKVFDLLLHWHDEGRYHWDFAQIELNYLDWNFADEINARNTDASYLYAELDKRGIPAVIMEPLLGGRLARLPEDIASHFRQRRPQASPAEWAFRFAGSPKGVLTVLSGMSYMEHLKENVRTYSPLQPLTDEEQTFLLDMAEELYGKKNVPCTGCNYCMPCPYGINIPAVFSHYNKSINEDRIPNFTDADRKAFFEQRRAFLISYDRAIPKQRQADHCIGCDHCVNRCPQRIDIPREMQKIDRLVERIKQG